MIDLLKKINLLEVNFTRNNVKYIAKLQNFNKKFIFEREFVNGFKYNLHKGQGAAFEFCFKNGDKKYYLIDRDGCLSENTPDEIKKIIITDEQRINFTYKYF